MSAKLRLPPGLETHILFGGRLGYDPRRCEVGRVKLRALDALELTEVDVEPGATPQTKADPNWGRRGVYKVAAIDLVAECEHYDPFGVLMWFPDLAAFGQYDDDHNEALLFVGSRWDDIVAAPAVFLSAQWRPSDLPGAKRLEPWTGGCRFEAFVELAPDLEAIAACADRETLELETTGALETLRIDAAEAWGRRFLELSPDDPLALRCVGEVHLLRQRWSEAQAAFEAAVALDPDDVLAQLYLGDVCQRRRRNAESAAAFGACRRPEARSRLLAALGHCRVFLSTAGVATTVEVLEQQGLSARTAPDGPGHLFWTEPLDPGRQARPNVRTAAGRARLDEQLVAKCGESTACDPWLLAVELGVDESAIRNALKRAGYRYDRREQRWTRAPQVSATDLAAAITKLPAELSPYALGEAAQRLKVSEAALKKALKRADYGYDATRMLWVKQTSEAERAAGGRLQARIAQVIVEEGDSMTGSSLDLHVVLISNELKLSNKKVKLALREAGYRWNAKTRRHERGA